MIANPVIPPPAAVPHPFTLNDFRVRSPIAEETSSMSARTFSGLVLAVVLALGGFIWLDPLHLFTPTEATAPAKAFVPPAEPAPLSDRRQISAPLTPAPTTKSDEMPIAPAPVVQVPHVAAPVVRPRAASIKPESSGNPTDKTTTTVLQASPEEETAEQTALPTLLTKPDERTNVPIAAKLGDDTKNAPKPAATDDQAPAAE